MTQKVFFKHFANAHGKCIFLMQILFNKKLSDNTSLDMRRKN